MTRPSSSSSSVPLIKGYLPLRVTYPPDALTSSVGGPSTTAGDRTTFLYVKEHASSSGEKGDGGGGATLFVANAPCDFDNVRTDVLLRALFGRHGGGVESVTVVRDPRASGGRESSGSGGGATTNLGSNEGGGEDPFRRAALAALADGGCGDGVLDGRDEEGCGGFARVSFRSRKEMRSTLKAVTREAGREGDDGRPASLLRLDRELMDRLAKESSRLDRRKRRADSDSENDNDEEEEEDEKGDDTGREVAGIDALVAKARRSMIPRADLLEMCNEAMAGYELEEEEAARKARELASQSDEDGFVTVSYGPGAVGSQRDFEVGQKEGSGHGHRRKAGKRSRNKKKGKAASGADELKDFYRFQMKETRKRGLQELRQRFEEDLAKVKKMKEERLYRPF